MHWKYRGAWLLMVGVLPCCSELPSIAIGTCGNGIVEAQNGEDCDTFPSTTCLPAGSKGECRFRCDTTGKDPKCATGWGCGSDGICRQPTSGFAEAKHPSSPPLARVSRADFDGDGRDDVIAVGADELHIHYFDTFESTEPFAGFTAVRPSAVPAVGILTKEDPPTSTYASADFVLLNQGGVNVMRGMPDRTFLPTPYSSFPLPTASLRVLALDAHPPSKNPNGDWEFLGDEVVVVAELRAFVPDDSDPKKVKEELFALPFAETQLLGEIQIANISEAPEVSPCPELVLTYKDASEILILTPCIKVGTEFTWNNKLDTLPTVKLPGLKVASGALAADLNADGHIDLLVMGAGGKLLASYGTGDGHFHSDPTKLPTLVDADQSFAALESLGSIGKSFTILAAGDLNHDGYPELVIGGSTSSILTSAPESLPNAWRYLPWAVSQERIWTEALITDLNRDGIPDIIAIADGDQGFDFFNGVGDGTFNAYSLRTVGTPWRMRTGDYDGDLINDVAYVERSEGVDDSLSVLFGRASGGPEQPVSMGKLDKIHSIAPMNVPQFGFDSISDLMVVTENDAGNASVAVLAGSSDRQMPSPLIMPAAVGQNSLARIAVVGQFDGDKDRHLDIAVLGARMVSTGSNRKADWLFWLLPSSGQAELDTAFIGVGQATSDDEIFLTGMMAAVNLDADAGNDEIVSLAPARGAQINPLQGGRLVITRTAVAADGKSLFVSDTAEQTTRQLWLSADVQTLGLTALGESLAKAFPGGQDLTGNVGGNIRVVDVDADGRADVAATGLLLQVGQPPVRSLVIYRNLGNGTLSASDGFAVDNPTEEMLQGFAFVQADMDPELELVLLTRRGGWLAQVDLPGKKLGAVVKIDSIKGGFDGISSDFDSDGVQDLVIVGEAGLSLHRGMAVRP